MYDSERRLFLTSFTAHGGALVASKLVASPFERLRVLQQVRGLVDQCPRAGLRHGFYDVIVKDGWFSMWRGCGAHVTGVVTSSILRLFAHQRLRFHLAASSTEGLRYQSFMQRCCTAIAAAWVALVVTYPLDVLHIYLAVDHGSQKRRLAGMWACQLKIRELGTWRSLYSGLPLCMATSVPFIPIAFGLHDALAKVYHGIRSHQGNEAVHPPAGLVIGAFAGLGAQSVTYPADTVRKWLVLSPGPRRWQRVSVHLRQQWCRRELARSLYSGFGIGLVRTVPEVSVLCFAYQWIVPATSTL